MALINTQVQSRNSTSTIETDRTRNKSITLKQSLIKRAEEARFEHRFASFSAFVEAALENYLEALENK
ncbi:hypothetical protein A6A19_00280 [Actinobacillus delphinicola]|uniref:hypothetical protein n=1 Tax=Actinobacillus delphinicola TaxID=51161 RepID=UPI002442E44F|nr:hypothetical protein [Actinobacillus delphinicola]MDG6896482.1 hypothetical protein [Actinobacillus delphinicola]